MSRRSVRLFAKGLRFPEGPAFDRNGNLFVVNTDNGDISKISSRGDVEKFVNTGGVPNGAKFHANGDLYVADRTKGIMAVSPEGNMKVIADSYKGKKFNGPNDLFFDSEGNLFFTDPHGSSAENPVGCVYRLPAGGDLELLASGLAYPNGLVLSADEKQLFVAVTRKNRILRYILGEPVRSTIFSQLSGGWGPDGMALDTAGNLHVAHYGGGAVLVLDPEGVLIEKVRVGGMHPTNVAFGGPDRKSLYVTEVDTGSVYCYDTDCQGSLLFGEMNA